MTASSTKAVLLLLAIAVHLQSTVLAAKGSRGHSHARTHSRRTDSSTARHRSSSGDVSVRPYVRKDGTYVSAHHRTRFDGDFNNNYSTRGNTNPYTGKDGTKVNAPSQSHYSTSTTRPSLNRSGVYSNWSASTSQPELPGIRFVRCSTCGGKGRGYCTSCRETGKCLSCGGRGTGGDDAQRATALGSCHVQCVTWLGVAVARSVGKQEG